MGASGIGLIKQSAAQLRNQDSEKQPGGSCSKSDGKSYEQLWSEQRKHRKRLRLGLQELMCRCKPGEIGAHPQDRFEGLG